MSEMTVPFDENASDNAVLLLAAAEELGLGAGVVKTNEGAFVVPQEVHDRAFRTEQEESPVAKKTATKRAAKKK